MLAELDMEEDDLQFAMTAYGLCVLLETHGEIEKADALREKLGPVKIYAQIYLQAPAE